jgi:hypothetical protein
MVHGRNSYKRSAALSQFVIHRSLCISTMQVGSRVGQQGLCPGSHGHSTWAGRQPGPLSRRTWTQPAGGASSQVHVGTVYRLGGQLVLLPTFTWAQHTGRKAARVSAQVHVETAHR